MQRTAHLTPPERSTGFPVLAAAAPDEHTVAAFVSRLLANFSFAKSAY